MSKYSIKRIYTATTLFLLVGVIALPSVVIADPLDYGIDYPWIWEWDEHYCSYDTDAAGPRVTYQYLNRIPSVMGICPELQDIDGEKGPVSNVGSHGRWAVMKNLPQTAWHAYTDGMKMNVSPEETAFLSDGSPFELYMLFVNWGSAKDAIYFDTMGDNTVSSTTPAGLRVGFDENETLPSMQGDVYARLGLDDGTVLEARAVNGVPYADFFVMHIKYDGVNTLSVEIKNRYRSITGSGSATLPEGRNIATSTPAYPLSLGRGDNPWEGTWYGAFRYIALFDQLLDAKKTAFMDDAIFASAFR